MDIILTKQEAIEILTDLFFDLVNNQLELAQGKISVGIEMKDE